MLETILSAVAIPILITLTVGVVCCVIVGVTCYYVGRYVHDEESRTLKKLEEELRNQSSDVKQSAINLADQTIQDSLTIMKQGEEQRKSLQKNTKKLDAEMVLIETTSISLEKISCNLQETAEQADQKVSELTHELEALKLEMMNINSQLKRTEDVCIQKELDFQEMVTLFERTQQSLQENTHQRQSEISALTQQLSEAQTWLERSPVKQDCMIEAEVAHLRGEHVRLEKNIKTLEETILRYKQAFESLSITHQQKLNEIELVSQENKRLTEKMNILSESLEVKHANRGMRLFNA